MRKKGLNIVKKIIYGFWVLFLFSLLIFIVSNNLLTVSKYKLQYENLPESFQGLKIVHLSDLHSKSFGRNNRRLVRRIDKESPDILVMTGDMVNSTDEDFGIFIDLSKILADKYDSYYIVGNHEQNLDDNKLQVLYDGLSQAGVHILDNSKISLNRGSETIDLYGLWFNLRYYSDQRSEFIRNHPEDYYFSLDKIETILGKKDPDSFTILLTHNPVYFPTYIDWEADLTLTGHIHGGMLRIPFLGGVFSPEKTFFPEYDAGDFEENKRHMIVSRGLGNGNVGMRFFNCPEIVVIEMN